MYNSSGHVLETRINKPSYVLKKVILLKKARGKYGGNSDNFN